MRADRNWTMATVRATRDAADGIRELHIAPQTGATRYPTGSHIAVRVLIDGQSDLRYYSLVGDRPQEGCWRIGVKYEESGRGGSRYMWSLQPGARLEVAEPDSHFELMRDSTEVLLIAGGIGITPMVGMAQALVRRGANVQLAYAARSRTHMAFVDELQPLLGEYLHLYSSQAGQSLDLAATFAKLPPQADVYICGPIGLLEAGRSTWEAAGRPRSKFIYETFGSSGRHPTAAFTVSVPRLGLDLEVPAHMSLLDALNEAGVGVLADCKRGECGLCAVDILASTGTIDHRDVFFSDHQHGQNKQLCACVSRVVQGGHITLDPPYRGDVPLRSGPEISPNL